MTTLLLSLLPLVGCAAMMRARLDDSGRISVQ